MWFTAMLAHAGEIRVRGVDGSVTTLSDLAPGVHTVTVTGPLRLSVAVGAGETVTLAESDGSWSVVARDTRGVLSSAGPAAPDRARFYPLTGPNHRPLVPIRLPDGTTLSALIDTGATHTNLCQETAVAAGFVATGTTEGFSPGTGLTSEQRGTLPSLELLGVVAIDPIVIVPPRLACNLTMIGWTTFSGLEFVIRPDGIRAWAGAPAAVTGPALQISPPRGIVVSVRAGQQTGLFLLDTGAFVTFLSPAFAERAGAVPTGRTIRLSTASGWVDLPIVRVPSLALGGLEVEDLEVAVGPVTDDGVLGMDFLSRFELRLSHGRLTISPP